MLDASGIAAAAKALYEAEKSNTQIGLISRANPDMDMDDAYRIQDACVALHEAAGRKRVGWKIGLTSKTMQNALGIDIPDSGVLFEDMIFRTGSTVPEGRFIRPRIEAEIAFIMGDDVLEPTRNAIKAATAYVAPSIEILDTRIVRRDPETGVARNVFDTIADNAANAGIVLGAERHAIGDFDLRRVGAIIKRNGVVEETGLGAAVLDDPLISMEWLARRLAEYGQKIQKGDIVLSGSFIRFVEAPPGSVFHAEFGPFGDVEIAFA